MGARKKVRMQKGSIHVYFRGNHQNNVFYSDHDKIIFLKMCDLFAKRYNTVIQEFVLMDNHVHLHIKTQNLTEFMRRFLQAYSRWYNAQHKTQGQLFTSPFNSSGKLSAEMQIDSMLYILQNPIRADMCSKPDGYKWTSYRFHFGLNTNLRYHIEVDTSQIDRHLGSLKNLNSAIIEKNISLNELKEASERLEVSGFTGSADTSADNLWISNRAGYHEITEYILYFIKNQISREASIFTLNKNELAQLAHQLRKDLNVSYNLISKMLHVSQAFVKNSCKKFLHE